MSEVTIANGCVEAPAGTWLTGDVQPVACRNTVTVRSLKGLIVPDRASLKVVTSSGTVWCADQRRPFLTRLDALPDEKLSLVSAKLLIAPFEARVGSRNVKLIPMSFRGVTRVTELQSGWAVAATAGRVTRVALTEGESLMVRPEAVVAWVGRDPTGFCPKLTLLDMLLPRGPKRLAFSFHGPSVVWFEGARAERSVRFKV